MAWFRIQLSEEEQAIVKEEQHSHPSVQIRRRMLLLWVLHCGLTREKAAEVAGISVATGARVVVAFRDRGLDGVRQWNVKGPISELVAYRDLIRASFEKEPVCTVAEAADRIEKLTGLRRNLTQVRKFLKGLGMKWQCIRAIPLPPKKVSKNMSTNSHNFCKTS